MKKVFLFSAFISLATIGANAQSSIFPTDGSNVGIGTTSPARKLDILSGSGVTPLGVVGPNGYMLIDNTGAGYNYFQANYLHQFQGTSNNPIMTLLADGNVGIGTASPNAKLEVNNGSSGANVLVSNTVGGYVSLGISSNAASYANLNFTNTLRLEGGPVGIGVINSPVSLFQVDDGCTKASIGDASGGGLNYGTSYLGFNASRSGTSWFTNGDGGNNGGGVMYSSIFGDMYFATVPTTGGTGQTLSDQTIANNIALKISHLDGAVYAKKIYVQLTGFPDYVFNKDYQLMPLSSVKSYIDKNHHLPEMPTDKEVEAKGLDVGEMNKLLTKKVEELTLYLIDLKAEKDKKEAALEEANKAQKALLNDQEVRLKRLEATIQQIINK